MKKTFLAISFSAALVCGFAANAATVTDQNQTNSNTLMANFSQSDLAQSFKQTSNNIAGAGILLSSGSGISDTVTISLWDALPNNSGTLLASASGTGTQGSWFDVFWNPVAITPNTSLFLVFTSLNNTLGIMGDTSNPYANGNVFANSGFSQFASYDYTFRTYTDTQGVSAVPIPAAAFLFAPALLGFMGLRRKAKNTVA